VRAVIQRVTQASVTINANEKRGIAQGLVVLVAVTQDDGLGDVEYVADKTAGLRIFEDAEGKMNLCVREIVGGACLVVSQFTLYGDVRRGKRPSFIAAASPDHAIPLYNQFIKALEQRLEMPVVTGEFGADMAVEIHNDGPVTILVDSKRLF